MKDILASLRMFVFMTVLLGIAYPIAMTLAGGALFHDKAEGQMVSVNGAIVGSRLIAQKFESPRYFWPRPSAVDFNPLPSGGSNLGPTSTDLKKAVDDRIAKQQNMEGGEKDGIPQDLIFASGSGLDPEISPEAARYQAARIAKNRGRDVAEINQLIESQTENRQWGFLGEARVNVLALNLALDNSLGGK